jgi:CRISPR/Cas system-associated protein Csx1
VDKFIYFQSKINSESRIDSEINRRIQNSLNFYKNVKEYYVTEILKQQKKTIYKEHLKPILIYLYKFKRWTLKKENKSKIQEMNVKFLRSFLMEKQEVAE